MELDVVVEKGKRMWDAARSCARRNIIMITPIAGQVSDIDAKEGLGQQLKLTYSQ